MSASSSAEPVVVACQEEGWSLATRVAFRFTFVFLALLIAPLPFEYVPGFSDLYTNTWTAAIQAVEPNAQPLQNGSGDTTWHWVQFFLQVAIACAATLVWSIVGRRALAHPRLHHWLRVATRFALAMSMIVYGAMKVIPSQFPPPTLDRLVQPFGDASPMGLLWTFMGASAAYTIFTGIGELLGGLLLTTRRTALAGALVCAAVMTHVVVLNFCYDVPVKIYSSQLLFMALFLIAPDAKRLAGFLFAAPPRAAWWKVALRTAVVVGFVALSLQQASTGRKQWGSSSPRSPLRGIWNVDQLTVDGVARPPLTTDLTRWRRMIFDSRRGMSIQLMSDERLRYRLADFKSDAFTLGKIEDPNYKARLTYKRPDASTLVVEGTMDGHAYRATMRRAGDSQFRLTTRGFHWINEYPFNR